MYRVHLESGANQVETPRIGESPSNQPISGLVIFSKRQALSRAVVVNSNMSRGTYLAREGPGSRQVNALASNQAQPLLIWRRRDLGLGASKNKRALIGQFKGKKSLQEGKFPHPRDGAPQPQVAT